MAVDTNVDRGEPQVTPIDKAPLKGNETDTKSLDPTFKALLDGQDKTDPHTTLEAIANHGKRDRAYFLASPEHFVLNPGHTDSDEIKALTQPLIDNGVAIVIDQDGKKHMALQIDGLAAYLATHTQDQPQAVADVCTILSEELKQFTNPTKQVQDLENIDEDLAVAQEDEDDDLVEELKDDQNFLQKDLAEKLATYPGQQLAIANCFSDPQFEAAINAYIDNQADKPRVSANGTTTNKTCGEYLDGVLESIRRSINDQKGQILSLLDKADFLAEKGLPLPDVARLEEVKL